jgi:hypothetical protein
MHFCEEVLAECYSARPDLLDQPLTSWTEVHWSGRQLDEQRQLWFLSLRPYRLNLCLLPLVSTSVQLAELIALTKALQLCEGKTANIYTVSKYTFLVLHAHMALWKERGLLTTEGFPIKHYREIKTIKSSFISKANSNNSLLRTSEVRGSDC